MTIFQLIMLGASAYFAFKIYEHIQTLKDPEENENEQTSEELDAPERSAEAFSTFDSSSLMEKADEAMDKEDFDKAMAIYSEANIKEPNNDETLFKMGYALSKQDRNDEALEYYKEAVEIDNQNPFTHLEMARIYIKNSEMASARTHLNAALEIDAEFTPAQEELEKLAKEH